MTDPPRVGTPGGSWEDSGCARRLGRAPAEEPPESFAVLLTCIDGRVQQPLSEWVRARYGVAYADVVTEPGMDAVLSSGADHLRQAVLDKVCVSRLAHHCRSLVIAGHHDCAANPGDRTDHERQIRLAVAFLRDALPRLQVAGVYVDETWTPQAVSD